MPWPQPSQPRPKQASGLEIAILRPPPAVTCLWLHEFASSGVRFPEWSGLSRSLVATVRIDLVVLNFWLTVKIHVSQCF